MKILFWGSSDYSVPFLQALIDKYEVVGVVTNPDKPFGRGLSEIHQTPIKILALEHSLRVLQPIKLRDEAFIDEVKGLSPDLSAIVSYGKIIPDSVIRLPRFESINVHASLLPSYRGASPIQAAIANGDKKTGNTIQFINSKMDEGEVIAQNELDIDPNEDYFSLEGRLSQSGVRLLMETLPLIESRTVVRKSQDHSKATYTALIKKEDGRVCFTTDTAQSIYNKWRAYKHWPQIYIEKENGQRLVITELSLIDEDSAKTSGTVIKANKDGIVVQSAKGLIAIKRLKPAGKKEMDAASFVNGYKIESGKNF